MASSTLRWNRNVFINFSGEDIHRRFVSHLCKALAQKSINSFIDAEELRKGDRLSEILTVIRESMLSIVVFSQHYASSTWCLKELEQILECKDNNNQIVLPIFYEVDPSDNREFRRSFDKAFTKHERRSNVDLTEVERWRSAVARAADITALDSRNYKDDAELIEKIVEDVFGKLNPISSTPIKDNHLIEMDSHMHEIEMESHMHEIEMDSHMHEMDLLLHPPGVETNDVRVVGILGTDGSGKTTIARAVYDEIAYRFKACCFLKNVKEDFMKHGKLHMQTQLLSSISGNKVGSSDISNKGFEVTLKNLGQIKVLVVVDEVDEFAQMEALLGKHNSFGDGSRVIITTRDEQLLSGANAIYKPNRLSDLGASELFRRHAFRTNQPTNDHEVLLSCVVQYAQGLPLALKVWGAFLNNKTASEWEEVLKNIRTIPQWEVRDVLKTSFDGLDDTEKDTFLDIACSENLDSSDYPFARIRVLLDRELLTVSESGTMEMHDSLKEMGREIRRQDVRHVPTENTATEAVESIIPNSSNSLE